ncbi:hypothetical protein D9611_003941 [Ephemerocybe angulata]|uniref:Uncharacterized protein n=1 Tax=Ephemerocybe angulata TaxID=980116 RepID=A0A8H5B643_9AGAR|nr:hypothetical protein D9611_003941 [Tulosesus angulatus]
MRQSLSDNPSSSSQTTHRPHKRRWTREQLLKNLEVLNSVDAPLPPTLPPSPPASRAASPAPGYKRKSDSSSDPEPIAPSTKRPRTSSMPDRRPLTANQQHPHHPHQPPHSHQPPNAQSASSSQPASASKPPPASASRTEPEEGEVREESSTSAQAPSIPAPAKANLDVPIRRPKRGRQSLRHFDVLHDTYHAQGRMLKYSGDARFWSTYPPTHREYRPLADPPSPNSSYHKYGGLIARLELVDALISFAYSIWSKEYPRRQCIKETWSTIEAFLGWCKKKWQAEEGIDDAEKAFVGLIWMIEAFIHGRKLMYAVTGHLDNDMNVVTKNLRGNIAKAADAAESISGGLSGVLHPHSSGTPIMLPSPASIAPANSANSTPTYKDTRTTNGASNSRDPPSTTQQPARPSRPQTGPSPVPAPLLPPHYANSTTPVPAHVMDAMAEVREPIGPVLAQDLHDFVSGYYASSWCMSTSQATLNLPIMMRCFPVTFNRMMHTTLTPLEEYEPDIEDEEGELHWPGQLITGEGLGWVCLMGKAMVKEFGKAYGYKGLDGVVPKPKPEGSAGESSHRPPPSSLPSNRSSFGPSNAHHMSNSSHGHR